MKIYNMDLQLRSKATKKEKEIAELHKQLPTPNQHIDTLLKNKDCYIYTSDNGYTRYRCISCGKTARLSKAQAEGKEPLYCQHCGNHITYRAGNIGWCKSPNRYYDDYKRITNVINNYYVDRIFRVTRYYLKGEVKTIIDEVEQRWYYSYNNKVIFKTISVTYNGMSCVHSRYNSDAHFSTSKRNYNTDTIHDCELPTFIKRLGITEQLINRLYNLERLIEEIQDKPYLENIFKMGQIKLGKYLINTYRIKNSQLTAIKIALRHKHLINDPSLFMDYISDLEYFNKDYHNPHYVCITDEKMREEHTKYTEKRRRIEEERRRIQAEETKKQRLLSERKIKAKYAKKMAFFGALCIQGTNVIITPIMSVKDVKIEGDLMHHCVFTNGYYKKDNVLLLTAKNENGDRIETIEYDLINNIVIQHRGKYNQQTEYGKQITTLISQNTKTITKLYKEYKKAI